MALHQRLYFLVKTLLTPPVPPDIVVAQRCNVVRPTVLRYRLLLAGKGWRWSDVSDCTAAELDRLLNGRPGVAPAEIEALDAYAESLGNGTPVGLLWEDYRRAQPRALSRSQFTRRLRSHRCRHAAPVLPRRHGPPPTSSDTQGDAE
ncbi:hypothetical protein DFR29_10375 [Tahibacter aquaticus]|uniref:Uncharacterized protein n=1 Tax=Tahibacter aquaticus TaxID=520092 RepID=A0A4R6Z4F6_9GAMM|nr:hypothetical protein [Tahibacter aquaticus]TDR46543.1 hypothetical protein DFR29_10375 [Tahibacter aquaticus]